MPTLDLAIARWQFRDTTSETWVPAPVPGCGHPDLRRAQQIPPPVSGTHDRGLSWYLISPSITIQSLKDVSRRSFLRAFAVGSQGVTPRTAAVGPDSTEWELDNAGSGRQLEGVHYPTDLIGYTVGFDAGLGGIILRTDDGGETWESQSANAAARLNDVFFIDALRGWAVGQAGTIVHTGRGGKP